MVGAVHTYSVPAHNSRCDQGAELEKGEQTTCSLVFADVLRSARARAPPSQLHLNRGGLHGTTAEVHFGHWGHH